MASEYLVEALLRLSRLIRRSTHPIHRSDITPEQYWLLKRLHRAGPLSIGALADGLGLTSASVTIACKRLEKAGLVQRCRQGEAGDERVVLVTLTERGLAQLEAWQERRRQFLDALLRRLSPDEQDQLFRLIARILDGTEMDFAADPIPIGNQERP
ncbi:MAG TPA: MarR family transcriptional regulator [Chloroflexota bacterium]|nr:MarR family transcriptional regulator [Chloroflexota bacterium]